MIKRIFKALVLAFFIVVSCYFFQMFNMESHALKKSEYSGKIYQLTKENKWESFSKERNVSTIKSEMNFKKEGELLLAFSFVKNLDSNLSFEIKKNATTIDSFKLKKDAKHETKLSVMSSDKVVMYVTSDSLKPYWGTVHTHFTTFELHMEDAIVAFLWLVISLFLFYKRYAYLAVWGYGTFMVSILAERLNFGVVSLETLLVYSFALFVLLFFYLFVYQILERIKKLRVAFMLLYALSVALIVVSLVSWLYVLNFKQPLNESALFAVFQSNSSESYEYVTTFVSFGYIALFMLILLFIGWLLYRQERVEKKRVEQSTLWLLMAVFMALTYEKSSNIKLFPFLYDYSVKYMDEVESFRKVQAKRKAGELQFVAKKEEGAETYIVLIGESLNKNHMGVYGYFRETTPLLSQQYKQKKLVRYENVYSNHVHTVQVLSMALTEANQYNKKSYYEALSILDILNKANVETYWLTNQNLYGGWDNMVSAIAQTAKHVVAKNTNIGYVVGTQNYDEVLIAEVKKILAQKSEKSRVIFVHFMGSHGSYEERYPKEKFSYYTKALKKEEFGEHLVKNKSINFYDNSIRYNDYVVGSILKSLQEVKGVRGLLFFADHADDINDDLGHNCNNLTYEMTEIPLLAWFSKQYQMHYAKKYETFVAHKGKLFSNDMLYDTMIGLFGIETPNYNAQYDLSSKAYTLEDNKSLVLHGERHYTEKKNRIYWQRESIAYLKAFGKIERAVPIKVHTFGKYKELINSGFSKFSMDISVKDSSLLQKIVARAENDGVTKIYVNYKDINEANVESVLKELDRLELKLSIKEKALIVFLVPPKLLEKFTKNGWKSKIDRGSSLKSLSLDESTFQEKFEASSQKENFVDFNSSYF